MSETKTPDLVSIILLLLKQETGVYPITWARVRDKTLYRASKETNLDQEIILTIKISVPMHNLLLCLAKARSTILMILQDQVDIMWLRLKTDIHPLPTPLAKVTEEIWLATSKRICLDQVIMTKNLILEKVKQLLSEADQAPTEKVATPVLENITPNMILLKTKYKQLL